MAHSNELRIIRSEPAPVTVYENALKSMTKASEYVLSLTKITRQPQYSDGTPESVAEHTLMAAAVGHELALSLRPDLNADRVSTILLFHDFDEAYAGRDIGMIGATAADLAIKEADYTEAIADMLIYMNGAHGACIDYGQLQEPEVIFAYQVDKLCPVLFRYIYGVTGMEELGVTSVDDWRRAVQATEERVKGLPGGADEFLWDIRERLFKELECRFGS